MTPREKRKRYMENRGYCKLAPEERKKRLQELFDTLKTLKTKQISL